MSVVRIHRAKKSQVKLDYAEAGASDAPALLLLHGWGQTWREWSIVIPALAKHYRVIAPDLRRLGDSSWPNSGHDTLRVATDIVELADRLGVERFFLVGHDIGAMTAYALASHWRSRIEKLVVLDIVLPGFSLEKAVRLGSEGWGVWHFVFHGSPLAKALTHGRLETYLSWFLRNMEYAPNAVPRAHIPVHVRVYQQPGALNAGLAYVRAADDSGQPNPATAAEKLTIPVLTIGGSASISTMVEDEMKRVAIDVTGAVAPESGRGIPEEQPVWLTKRLLEFLR